MVICAVLALATAPSRAQTPAQSSLTGEWEGAFVRLNSVQLLTIHLFEHDGRLRGAEQIPELLVDDPIEIEVSDPLHVTLKLKYGRFEMLLSEDGYEMTGENSKWGPPVALHLKRASRLPCCLRRAIVSFRSGPVALRGLVARTEGGATRRPGIVVVAGSGAQGIATNSYAFWADYFASRGLVAMIYDKRGVGESQGSWQRAGIPELAEDAAAAFRRLKSRPDVDPRRIGMMGLSQGGWVVPLAAMSLPDSAFTILDVAPSVSVYEQELQRVEYSMKAAELPSGDIEDALRYTRALLAAAKTGKGSEALAEDAAKVGKKPWAEFVDLDVTPAGLEGWKALQYEPAPALRALRTPVLVLYGQRDTLVPPEENADRMRDSLTKEGNRDVTVTIVPGAQHNMELFGTLRNGKWHWPDSFWSWAHRSRVFYEAIDRWLASRNFISPSSRASGNRNVEAQER